MKSEGSRLWLRRRFACYVVLLAMLFSLTGITSPALVLADNGAESGPATSLIGTEATSSTDQTVTSAVYTVTADSAITGGSIAVNPPSGAPGDTVTVTVTPDSGKQLAPGSLKYIADSGSTYTAISVAGDVYSFPLPAADVVVTAQFEDIINKIPELVPMATIVTDGATVAGGDTISAGGTYNVAADATGTITIDSGLTVTLVGSGVTNEPNRELSVDCGAGVTLTIRDLYVSNTDEINLLNFTGSGNRLLVAGVNVLEGMVYNAKAVIHVGPGTELTIDGADGTMYLYKYTAGSGIGGDIHEANGRINFAGGNLFIKGSKTGAVIGNDTCGDETKEAQIGDITISGGKIYIEANARGAAIGGSSMSAGGNVYMTGGTLAIYVDWTGSAIGAGGSERVAADAKCGNLIITGGSLKVFVDQNAAYDWGLTKAKVCDNPITAAKLNALTGGAAVYRYMLDVSGIEADANGEYDVTVDGAPYYTGGLHDYEYTASIESTMANWTKTDADSHIYLYLTLGAHTVSVNGQTLEPINVVVPDYSEDTVEIPAAQWSEAADTSWYNTTGTSFQINTAGELAGLAALVNAGTDDFRGKTVTLTEDVNLSEREWTAIGTYDDATSTGTAFAGTFDGGNNAISGLLIGDMNKYYQGLFGYVSGATLKNITVASGYITGYEYLGGVAGRAVDSTITGCDNRATVYGVYKNPGGSRRTGGDYCGGIVGNGENCTIASCQNNGSVGGLRNSAGIAGLFYGTITNCVNKHECLTLWEGVAGIVAICGNNSTDPNNIPHTTISNCRNEADLSGQVVSGITGGSSNVQITKCSNTGDLTGCATGGGITAFIDGNNVEISKCFNSGDITATANSGEGIGGIAGCIRNGSDTVPRFVIDCYNTGAVTNKGAADTDAGGIVGHLQKVYTCHYVVENCYNTGAVSTQVAGTQAGGVVGDILSSLFGDIDITNNYYLEGSAAGGIAGVDTPGSAEVKTAAALQQLSVALGASYADDNAAEPVNGGYPVLRWQAGLQQPTCNVTFSVNVATAVVTVKDAAGATVAPDSSGGYPLIAGDVYSYSVTAEGYEPSSGSVFPNGDTEISVTLTAMEDPGEPVVYGDINGDGNINSQDVVLLRKHVANLSLLSEDQLPAADVNKDGAVNSQDITKLRRYVANILTSIDSTITLSYDETYTLVTTGSASAAPGATVTVPVTIANNPGFAAFAFTIGYDAEALELTAITKGDMLTSEDGAFTKNIAGNIVTWDDLYNTTAAGGTLFTLTFNVKDTTVVGSVYPITVGTQGSQVICDENAQVVPALATPGAITVAGRTPPTLHADTAGNTVGQAVYLSFTDDEAWRNAISGITVNGTALTGEQYTVSAGRINLAAGVFSAAGDYTVTVTASGYSDATVTQTMNEATAGYTVTFVSDGTTYTTQTAASGATMEAPADPAKDSYTFGGWYTDETWTTAVSFPYTVTGDVMLYAKWTPAPAGSPKYTVAPAADASVYEVGATPGGISTMTVKTGVSGLKYFGVQVTPIKAHEGQESVVFVHLRNEAQQSLNVTKADFDTVQTALAGFNVQPGDLVEVYIVDELTNAVDHNPTILQ